MIIKVTKNDIIELVSLAVNNEEAIENLRCFTFSYFKADDEYIFESPDIRNFFRVVEGYNTYDEAFGDVNQKLTLIRLRDALMKHKEWEEELLVAAVSYDVIQLLEMKKMEGRLDADQFEAELRKYCYERNDLNRLIDYYTSMKINKKE